jgi:putative SOS response-associated peptidase YedK
MCGRFTLAPKGPDFLSYFDLMESLDFTPRYNIYPGQDVLIIRSNEKNHREATFAHWGLIPTWQKEEDIGTNWINARSETIMEKKLFKTPFQQKRCLIIADGFYEWKSIPRSKIKQPYYFHQKNNTPFGFAGIWEHWESPSGKIIDSCCILTTAANKIVKPVHIRMPIIIPQDYYKSWLNHANIEHSYFEKIVEMISNKTLLVKTPVSMYVNNPRNEGKECTKAIINEK